MLEELDRILISDTFQTAECHRNFLRYTVLQTLAGRGGDIKEYSVATEALGKDNSFDPRLDPIVRVQASKLRARLARYYATEGIGNPLRIELPKGSYSPILIKSGTAAQPEAIQPESIQPESIQPESTQPESTQPEPASRRDKEVRETKSGFVLSRRWALTLLASLLLCAAAVSAGWFMLERTGGARPSLPASIVITPFQNLSDSREDEFFSDGLTEELINSMARLKDVHVIGRTSAFQFKNKAIDIREIGRKLHVATVLQGTVRRHAGRVRISAQLSESLSGTVVWSQIYDQDATDAVGIQSDIANTITAELGGHLSTWRNKFSPTNTGTVNRSAYEAYLKGRYFCAKRTPKTVEMAIDYFQQALKLDSAYAPAWAAIADCYAVAPALKDASYTDAIPKITAAARRSIAIDPNVGLAYIDLGIASMFNYDWAPAEENFLRGIGLNPNDALAHHWYGVFLLLTGRVREGLRENELALSLDPISPEMAGAYGRALRFDGQLDASILQLSKALVIDPNYGANRQQLTMAYLQKHMYSDAIVEAKKAVALMDNVADPFTGAQLGFAYGQGGHPSDARRMLGELLPLAVNGHFPEQQIAAIYFGLGDLDNTFLWYEKAIEKRSGGVYLKADPLFAPLRSDPRYSRLLGKMSLEN